MTAGSIRVRCVCGLAVAAALAVGCSSGGDDGPGSDAGVDSADVGGPDATDGGGVSPLVGTWEIDTQTVMEPSCSLEVWVTPELVGYRFGAFGGTDGITSVRFGGPYSAPVRCDVTASSFDCTETIVDSLFGTTLTFAYRWYGTFDEAGTMTGGSQVDLDCSGGSCSAIGAGAYPCTTHATFTAARIGPHIVDPYAPCPDGTCSEGQTCTGGYCLPLCEGTFDQCIGTDTTVTRCTGVGTTCTVVCTVGGAPCPDGFECAPTGVRVGDADCRLPL